MRRTVLSMCLVIAFASPALAQMGGGTRATGSEHQIVCEEMFTVVHQMMGLVASDPNSEMASTMKHLDDDEKDCSYPHYVAGAQAFETYAKAVIAHRSGDTSWPATLDSAIAQLTACQSFWGTAKLGAHCGDLITTANKNKSDWSAASASAAPATAHP